MVVQGPLLMTANQQVMDNDIIIIILALQSGTSARIC